MISIDHLDVNIVSHCMNRCVACNHAAPFAPVYFMSQEVLRRDLAALLPFLHCGNIMILGGEPLLHPEITELLLLARESGVADTVTISTNGKRLQNMPEAFWLAKPLLQINIYADLDMANITHAQQMAEKYEFPSPRLYPHAEFYAQFKKSDGSSFYACPWKSCCYTVHDRYFYLCPQSAFFPSRFMGLPIAIDGLPLEDLTEEKLTAFMARKEPLKTCTICEGYTKLIPWHQCITEEEWMRESTI